MDREYTYVDENLIDLVDLRRRFPEATSAIEPLLTAYQRADALYRLSSAQRNAVCDEVPVVAWMMYDWNDSSAAIWRYELAEIIDAALDDWGITERVVRPGGAIEVPEALRQAIHNHVQALLSDHQ